MLKPVIIVLTYLVIQLVVNYGSAQTQSSSEYKDAEEGLTPRDRVLARQTQKCMTQARSQYRRLKIRLAYCFNACMLEKVEWLKVNKQNTPLIANEIAKIDDFVKNTLAGLQENVNTCDSITGENLCQLYGKVKACVKNATMVVD